MAFIHSSFDTKAFIQEIKKRPALWDTSSQLWKDRVARKIAWDEMLEIFIPKFEEKTEEEKNKLSKEIQQKWKYIRDAYIRQIRLRSERRDDRLSDPKEYIYADDLSFLQKKAYYSALYAEKSISKRPRIIPKLPGATSYITVINTAKRTSDDADADVSNGTQQVHKFRKILPKPTTVHTFKVMKNPRQNVNEDRINTRQTTCEENVNKELIIADTHDVQEKTTVLERRSLCSDINENDDMIFFRSLLPTLSDMRQDRRLLFRIDVMKLLHKYTQENSENTSMVENPLEESLESEDSRSMSNFESIDSFKVEEIIIS